MMRNIHYILAFVYFFIVLIFSNRDNAVLSYYNFDEYNFSFFRQGWAFFTKDVHEPQITVFEYPSNNKVYLQGFQSEYLWGLNKKNRVIQYEIENSLKKIDKKLFTNSHNYMNSCNVTLKNIKKGKYIVNIKEPIPWMWFAKSKRDISMPSKYIILNNM